MVVVVVVAVAVRSILNPGEYGVYVARMAVVRLIRNRAERDVCGVWMVWSILNPGERGVYGVYGEWIAGVYGWAMPYPVEWVRRMILALVVVVVVCVGIYYASVFARVCVVA